MKRQIAIGLALLLLLSGCGQQESPPDRTTAAEESTEASTAPAETTAPQPACKDITVMGENIPLVRFFLDEGEQVEVTGYRDALARVTARGEEGFVEKQYLRFPDETFGQFTGYARWNTGLYGAPSCLGEPLQTLNTNAKLEVLEELDNCYYVNIDDQKGYVAKDGVSKWAIQSQPAEESGSGNGGGGGSSSGGSSSSGSKDGGDITMLERGSLVLLADAVKTGTARVKVPGTPMVTRNCLPGESLQMVVSQGAAEEIPGYVPVLEPDGSIAYISESWVLLPEEKPFESWEGYAGYHCSLYGSENLSGRENKTISANTKVTVLWDTGTVSYIQVGEETGYVASANLRRTPIAAAPAEENGGSSSSGGSGSSGGSSSGSGSGGGDIWTPVIK